MKKVKSKAFGWRLFDSNRVRCSFGHPLSMHFLRFAFFRAVGAFLLFAMRSMKVEAVCSVVYLNAALCIENWIHQIFYFMVVI